MAWYSSHDLPLHQKSALDHERVTRANQLNSPLLRLPAELRNNIYQHVFPGSLIELHHPRCCKDYNYRYKHSRNNFGLLRSCKQIYTEAYGMYPSAATFRIQHVGIQNFIKRFESTKMGLVTSIECTTDEQWDVDWAKFPTAQFVALKRLHFVRVDWAPRISAEKVQAMLDALTGG